ncbi:MAG: hypothetical protein IJY96_07750 [Oscillospiraceae bacterium]|nr:hypothetical protein [Oscillospiraceae bacterium]
MANENGEWIMHGLPWDDPRRLRTWREVTVRVNELGFLPLFKNSLPGFSVEEQVSALFWWTGDPAQDPWEWREIIARSGEVAYGKFFGKKAGFISKEWFPHFANFRRDGYDFDTLWDEEMASMRCKKIMDRFTDTQALPSNILKQLAGFGKGGEKNFDGTVTELQMKSYLIIRDFRRRRNKMGLEFGMPVSVFSTPESLWGYDHVTSAYSFDPSESMKLIVAQLQKHFPDADTAALENAIK